MRLIALAATSALLAALPASAFAQEGDVAAFFRLRTEGVAAAQADDTATARARLDEAHARNPNHPGLTLMRARLAMGEGRTADAAELVARYAGYGLNFNLAGDAALGSLAGTPELAEAEARLARNREPESARRLRPLVQIPGSGLTEAVVYDAPRNRWLVSQVAGRTIVAVDGDGEVSPYLQDGPGTGPAIAGVLGLALSPDGSILWAAAAPVPPATYAMGQETPEADPVLLKIHVPTGRIFHRYDIPGDGERSPGDLAVGPDGTVYVSDSAAGAIYRLTGGQGVLETLVEPGTVGSPQGVVVHPNGGALVVADYPSGLWRVDLASGAITRVPTPDHASLIGIDGLALDGERLYALQNGTNPQRVLRMDLNADWSAIDGIDVVAANLAEIDEPTNGFVLDGDLIFVARSQWSDFNAEGAPAVDMAPARIVRLQLD